MKSNIVSPHGTPLTATFIVSSICVNIKLLVNINDSWASSLCLLSAVMLHSQVPSLQHLQKNLVHTCRLTSAHSYMDMCELFSKSYRLAFSIKDRSVTFRSSSKDSFHCLSVIPGQCMQIIFSLKTARTDSALKLCSPLNLSVEDVHLTTSWSSGVLVLQKCQFNVYHPHMTASAPRATCFSYYCHVVWIPTLIPPERQSSCSPRVCFQSAETNYTQLASRFFPREMMSMEPVLQ